MNHIINIDNNIEYNVPESKFGDLMEAIKAAGSSAQSPLPPPLPVHKLAECAHEAQRSYCGLTGKEQAVAWESTEAWYKKSQEDAVTYLISNPGVGCEDVHLNWCRVKKEDGWKHGAVKDAGEKVHNLLVDYKDLPDEQKQKDILFHSIVRGLRSVDV